MSGLREAVAAFLAERDDFIRALKNCTGANSDYWRWQGHAEARRMFGAVLERDGIDLTAESNELPARSNVGPGAVGSSESIARVLIAHQRRDIGSCLCGWDRLGASYADHVADALLAAGVFRDEATVKAEVAKRFRQDAIDEAVDGKLNLTAVIRMATEAGGAS